MLLQPEKFLRVALPPIGPVGETPKEKEEKTPEEGEEIEKEELFLTKRREEARLQI